MQRMYAISFRFFADYFLKTFSFFFVYPPYFRNSDEIKIGGKAKKWEMLMWKIKSTKKK